MEKKITDKSKKKAQYISNLLLAGINQKIIAKLLHTTKHSIANYQTLAQKLNYLPDKHIITPHEIVQNVHFQKLKLLEALNFSYKIIANNLFVSEKTLWLLRRSNRENVGDNTGIIFQLTKDIPEYNLCVDDTIIIKSFIENNEYVIRLKRINELADWESKEFVNCNPEFLINNLIIISAFPILFNFYVMKNTYIHSNPLLGEYS